MTITDLYKLYQEVTTRWSWAPENMRNDLELDLGHAITRHGDEVVAEALEVWAAEVAKGETSGHLWGLLQRLKKLEPTPQVDRQKPSVALTKCGGCEQEVTALSVDGLCLRCASERSTT